MLVAYYPFNGNAIDESGNGNDGTVYGATLTSDRFGNDNSAYYFDGEEDYITIGENVKPPFPVSISSWIYLNEIKIECIIRNDKVDSGSYRYGLAIYIMSDGKIKAVYYEGFSASWNRLGKESNDSIATIGGWHHYLVVFAEHMNIKLYWDGTEIEGEYDGTGSGMSYSSDIGTIGHFKTNTGPPPNRYFNGSIDDIRVYERVLSEDEINALYIEGNPSFVDELKQCTSNLKIYPNPFSSETSINFSNPNNSNYKLSIFNISGNKVFEMDNIKSDKIEFKRGNLPEGVYMIELKGEKVFRSKIVVK
ncbi:MAG: T9SS type A sorting domain-containing protein [Bacteroidetes bacterium]|nr:T9SS type A sorting domain-containing protein [Bacteroidota bacterium]MBL7102886.1 T9SS type A sorting domain-containing protein [Bacteroidales bacterium]